MRQPSPIRCANPLTDPPSACFDLLLANPPFGGALDKSQVASHLRGARTELLFTDLALSALKVGGRAALLLPAGVLFGQTKAHSALRRELVAQNRLSTIIVLPPETFRPAAARRSRGRAKSGSGVQAYLLIFTAGGRTDTVRFCELSDLGPAALTTLMASQTLSALDKLDCACWTATYDEIAANDYRLLPRRYQPWDAPDPAVSVEEAWADLKALEAQIAATTAELEGMLADLGYDLPAEIKALTEAPDG